PSASSAASARKAARSIPSSRRTSTSITAKSAVTCTSPRTCCWPWATATRPRSPSAAPRTPLTVDRRGKQAMTFTSFLFYVLAAVLVFAAFRVISARSPVTAVMHLILAFFNAAMLWMLLGAEFLALLLVLVYVGAVMVLFLFVVMMLDIRLEALRAGFKTYLPLGLAIGLVMVAEMAFVLATTWADSGPLPLP